MVKKIKLLIVDDSALMRRQLSTLFESTNLFIIKTARNGQEAIDENLAFEPDVITLDINMPEMDGITALSHIVTTRHVPVVMVSSLTEKGALATFEALALGAVDYVAKPGGTISLSMKEVEKTLIQKVKAAASANINSKSKQINLRKPEMPPEPKKDDYKLSYKMLASKSIVIIGVSTGGPGTLEHIFSTLPPAFPLPIVVAQHMPESFTSAFAQRMDKIFSFNVVEVNRPMPIESKTIYIAKGGADTVIGNRRGQRFLLPKPPNDEFLWHPSVEQLGRSALEHYRPEDIIAVMLTGMGNDGSDSFKDIHSRGGRTIAESEESAIVYGMPKELIEKKGANVILPASKIAAQLEKWCM